MFKIYDYPHFDKIAIFSQKYTPRFWQGEYYSGRWRKGIRKLSAQPGGPIAPGALDKRVVPGL